MKIRTIQTRRDLTQTIDLERAEAVRRLDAVRGKIGRLGGPTIVEELRDDRHRDER